MNQKLRSHYDIKNKFKFTNNLMLRNLYTDLSTLEFPPFSL